MAEGSIVIEITVFGFVLHYWLLEHVERAMGLTINRPE